MKSYPNLIQILSFILFGVIILIPQRVFAQYCTSCESGYVTCGELIHNNSFESTNDPSGLGYCDGNIENACCWTDLFTHKSNVDHLNVNNPNDPCAGFPFDSSPPFASNINQDPSLDACLTSNQCGPVYSS